MFYTKMLAVSLRKKHCESRNYIIFEGIKIDLLTKKEIENMSEEKLKFIESFEEFVEKHYTSDIDIWKDVNEISSITGTTTDNVVKYVESFDEFVKNSKGKYTTRKEYENKTKFFKKLLDTYVNKIK